MALKKLFLCHYCGDATEVRELALELRLHGILPWVDKQGGFSIADDCAAEARRAISEDCFGLLIYATERVFERPFIREVEMDQAIKAHESDLSFALFAVPRGISFKTLTERSQQHFGIDLSRFHTVDIPDDAMLAESQAEVASMVAERVIEQAGACSGQFSLQYSTRDLMPHQPQDVLCIDARELFRRSVSDCMGWTRLLNALRQIKGAVSASRGRPRLCVHGSKHLTAAFMFGRVFAPFEIDIRQTREAVWSTDYPSSSEAPFRATVKTLHNGNQRLFLEIASQYKNIERGVDGFLAEGGPQPSARLQLGPLHDALSLDNALCRAAVAQTYNELDQVLRSRPIAEIHLFAAVPQSFMMMLGRELKGAPPVYLYEWTGSRYEGSYCLPGGVL
jgi:hypothetical protein